MANYGITKHTLDWDIPLNADLNDIDARLTSGETRTSGRTFYYLVAASDQPAAVKAKADYVCTGIGDQVQIQSAVNAAFADGGGIVQLTDGIFSTSAPITLHPLVTLQGAHGDQIFNPGQLTVQSFIRPDALFVGGAAIVMLGQTAGGYANKPADSRIYHLTINGDLSPAGVHGIQASDYIHGAVLEDVAIVRPKGKGIYTFTENGAQPFSWTFRRVLVDNAGDVGIHLINHTDCTMVDVISIGSNTFGFQLSNMPNSRLIGCRAEWSEAHGYKIEGNFGTGAGSGGMLFSGCSTDRNGQNGFDITSTGNAPITLDGIDTRRDGRNGGGGGGGYAGINAVGATTPVLITGWSQYPGVDDDGTGGNSPSHGGVFQSNSSVQISNAYVHGALDGVVNGGANTIFQLEGVVNASGLTSAPVRSEPLTTNAAGWVSVKDPKFNALGDGTTNDATSIQLAINSLGAAGGTVYFPPGTYLLGAGLTATTPITFRGSGPGSSILKVGPGVASSNAITITSDDCVVTDLRITGNTTTTTSNPIAGGVLIVGVKSVRILNTTFDFLNAYAIQAFGTSSSTLHGGMIDNVKIQSCAGGVYVKSDNANTAANFQISNLFTRFLGVSSGGSANLDGIKIEDSWDVLMQNIMPWMNATTGGTGAALRIIGNCAAMFIQNLDALGPQTGGANVVIQGGANGSPQNVQINGGVIQQGTVGLVISDATNQVRVRGVRIINNQTHGVSVTSTGFAIFLDECLFSLNGAGAAGTNYDINWSGTATGYVTDCRIGSNIVTVGTAGVQGSMNVAADQNVRVLNADFSGSGSASTNWFTNFPQVVTRQDGTNEEHSGNLDFRLATNKRVSFRANAAGNNAIAFNVQGADATDRGRILGDGSLNYGDGTAARDTSWGRLAAARIGSSDSDIAAGLAGKTFIIKGGTNAKAGTVTANGTTAVTVSTTAVTANSTIVLSYASGTTNTTAPYVSALTAGTSFQIKSAASDVCVYNWAIIERN